MGVMLHGLGGARWPPLFVFCLIFYLELHRGAMGSSHGPLARHGCARRAQLH